MPDNRLPRIGFLTRTSSLVILWVFVILSLPLLASPQINVVALFKNKAIFYVDGIKHVLNVGESTPQGIRLIESSATFAVLDVQGNKQRFELGRDQASPIKVPVTMQHTVWPNPDGMYITEGQLNGRTMKLMVDTGATYVALNEKQAQQLGIPYLQGQPIPIATASKRETGYLIKLSQLKLGGIRLYDVDAVILPGNFPNVALLGMSFLKSLHITRHGEALVLEKKF